jgi:hypothetical protein
MALCRAIEIFQIMKNIFIQAIDFRKPMKSCGNASEILDDWHRKT